MPPSTAIPAQVELPLRMAGGVVAQGIRIRLGRSIVTLTGVVLGIAFLMSVLTSQVLRRGVAEEDRLREDASRMYGYLAAETGSVFARPIAVVVTGPLSGAEIRLLERLEREDISELRVAAAGAPLPAAALERLAVRRLGDPRTLGSGAAALLVLGSGRLPRFDYPELVSALRKPVVAFTGTRAETPSFATGATTLRLNRELPADEQARRAAAVERERFRGLWIIVISLLVTVIGIANAMLMSVTERFRDIGTMKCLGATSRFIRTIFLLEACFMGLVGGAAGVVLGSLFSLIGFVFVYDFALLGDTLTGQFGALVLASAEALAAGIALSVIAALYPAHFAATMVPADALRSNI
jgi:hypothetical protein